MRLFLFLLVFLLINSAVIMGVSHEQYPSFSSADQHISLMGNDLAVADDAVFKNGYYSVNGGAWQSFDLEGELYGNSNDWLAGTATVSIPVSLQGPGEHYIIVYSCSSGNGEWDCHGGWQLRVLREEISLTAWVTLDNTTGNSKVIVKPTDDLEDPWEVYALDINDGKLRFIISNGSSYANGGWQALTAPVSSGEEHFFAGTYDGQEMNLYIDGALANTTTVLMSIAKSNQELHIGSYPGCCVLQGTVRDEQVYDFALSAQEIVDMYGQEPAVCTGSTTQSCMIINGQGEQKRTCTDGIWSSWGTCMISSCDDGYDLQDNTCVQEQPPVGDGCSQEQYYNEGASACLLSVSGETYFVAPDGNDDTSGSFTQPWKTFQKAFNTVRAGDIVYFRGGVYYTNDTQRLSVSGTESRPIRFFNFPHEQPIIDGSQRTVDVVTMWSGGIGGSSISNVHFKGITVRNLEQLATDYAPMGFTFSYPDNIILENCVAHNIGYRGFWFYAPGTVYVKNCDAYNVVDPLSDVPGNHGDGFIVWDEHDETANLDSHVVFEGCRAWNNSDDGWDAESEGYIGIYNSWAFDNGYAEFAPGGNGFKLGLTRVHKPELARMVSNSIIAGNLASGLTTNDNACEVKEMNIYNNIAYNNGRSGDDKSGMGFVIYNTINSPEEELVRAFRNNVAYANEEEDIIAFSTAAYTSEFNSWDLPVAVTDDNFVSLDISQLSAPRKADGSLPDIDFGHLSPGSNLIDSGTIIPGYHCETNGSHPGEDCVEWYGNAPDLGPFEYRG